MLKPLPALAALLVIALLSACSGGGASGDAPLVATIALTPGTVVGGATVVATVDFNRPVIGFAAGDLVVAGGTPGAFAFIQPGKYTLAITAGGAGTTTVDVDLAAGACTDLHGRALSAPASAQAAVALAAWGTTGSDVHGAYADLAVTTAFGSGTQRFRLIAPGTFTMGSPVGEAGREPQYAGSENAHQVTLTTPYWIADSECTQRLWFAVTNANPSFHTAGGLDLPVEQVSWTAVDAFIASLNTAVPGLGAQLPSEAELEYATRAGTTGAFSLATVSTATITCWVDAGDPYVSTGATPGIRVTRSLLMNPWGLYDVHGNVWEWCRDWYVNDLGTLPVTDPVGPASGSERALRGGSWGDYGTYARSATRRHATPSTTSGGMGFRLVAPVQPGGVVRRPAPACDAQATASRHVGWAPTTLIGILAGEARQP
jgi:formylglycine-generating enzyme required for sulfatase activity